jgi:predicted glycogen debranching enzyme
MSYFKFGTSILKNTQRAISMELLDSNKLGAYTSTTVAGCNTRKYHGLLSVPLKNLGESNHVLISSLDESVLLNGKEFKLGMHKFANDHYEPQGNKYLCSMTYDKVPCLTYRLGGTLFTKEILLSSTENRVMVRFTLLDAGQTNTCIRFSPTLAFRSVNSLCQANYNVTTNYQHIENGISICLYTGYPELSMQFSKPVTFISKPSWMRGVEYLKEQWRGYDFKEDLFVPGYFQLEMSIGESIVFTSGLTETKVDGLLHTFSLEVDKKPNNSNPKSSLRNAALKCFLRKSAREIYPKAGFHWFGCRARDLFMSLPGFTIPFDDKKTFESVINSMIPSINDFMEGKGNKTEMPDFDNPDIFLLIIRDIQIYASKYGLEGAWANFGGLIRNLMDYMKGGKHPLTEIHDNGMLYVREGWQRPITWMNAKMANGQPITPRSGYVVEINALWHNALRFVAELSKKINDDTYALQLNEIADNQRNNFTPVFWNGTYLFDFVDGDHHEVSVRPNMLFAVALPYSPLDEIQKKMVLDMSTKELLTPKGLRTLSPHSQNYHGWCGGNQETRDNAAFQGAVYPWLMGTYIDAYLKVYKQSGFDFAKRSLMAFAEELKQNCIGTLSEMYDATQPFTARGGTSFLMNVAEICRAFDSIENYK